MLMLFAMVCGCDFTIQTRADAGTATGGSSAFDAGATGGGSASGGGSSVVDSGSADAGHDAGAIDSGVIDGGPITPGDCTGGLSCEIFGATYFCVDVNSTWGAPANATVCSQNAPCASGFACFHENFGDPEGRCFSECEYDTSAFVAGGVSKRIDGEAVMQLGLPEGFQTADLLLAVIDADESAGPHTLTAPGGWAAVGGFPLHHVASSHTTMNPPASQNHGVWLFTKSATANESTTQTFTFSANASARAVVQAYRGVATSNPIHDKAAGGVFSYGNDPRATSSGGTSLAQARQVNIVATGRTTYATYSRLLNDSRLNERFNSGESPDGLTIVVQDSTVMNGFYKTAEITHFESPSNSMRDLLWVTATLVLTPR